MCRHLERVLPSWLATVLRSDDTSHRRGRKRRRHRLEAELRPLEDRRLLSIFPVTSTADDGGAGTLRWAVGEANADTSPSTIVFELGTVPATIALTKGQLDLSNTTGWVTIEDGPGQGPVALSGNNQGGAFQVESGVTAMIANLTITGGATLESHGGGSINDFGTLTLSDCTITNNALTSNSGSGVYVDGTANITDCTITGGNSDYGAGIDIFRGSAEISGCTIDDNTGEGNVVGAGVFNGGTTTLVNCTISGNSAGGSGGGVYNSSAGQLKVQGGTIGGNTSANEGAGLYNLGVADLSDCTISGNSNDNTGGGVWNGDAATINLTNCTISGNTGFVGGGLSNDGNATLTDCTISQNTAYRGGGVANGPLRTTATLTLTGSTVSDNVAMMGGGGVFNYGQAALTDSTIANNSVDQGISTTTTNGGGLDDSGTATLVACTISGNSSTAGGGGIFVGGPGIDRVTLDNTIVVGNDSVPTVGGAAIPNDIITGTSGAVVSGSYNLVGIGGAAGLTDGTDGNIVLTSLSDLGLAPLGSYGGPTETMALLPESKAIAAGGAAMEVDSQGRAFTTDQRGDPMDAPVPDIGAYQSSDPVSLPASLPVSLSFTGLTSSSIAFGTARVTISGVLAGGNQSPPDTESVQITLDGVTQVAALGGGGAFSTTFDTSTLGASGAPYTIRYSYASDGTYASATAAGALTVSQATPTLNVTDSGGTYNGAAFGATAAVTGTDGPPASGLEGVAPALVYYAGTSATGAPLTGAPTAAGTYTVVASFAGSADYAATRSQPVTFAIARAGTEIVLLPQRSIKNKKVVSVVLTAEVMPIAAGGNLPTGSVVFELKQKKVTTPQTVALAGGEATLTLKAKDVLHKPITITYAGDANFSSSTDTPPAMTHQALKGLARPVVALHRRGLGHARALAERRHISPG